MKPTEPRPLYDGDAFDAAWRMCEERGKCDAFGGAEYRRLRRQWDKLIGLAYALDFIASAANAPPLAAPGKDGAP